MAKFSTSLTQLKEFAKIAKEPIDAQNLNKSIASIVTSLSVLQELASTANKGNLAKLRGEYNALFEIVKKIQEFQKNGGTTKDPKLTASANSMTKNIDKLEDRMIAYYGRSKKEAEGYLVKQRDLVKLMKDENLSAKERYDLSRQINRLNIEASDTVQSLVATENALQKKRELEYSNKLKTLSVSKQQVVIDEKATNTKLEQLQIDKAIGKRSIEESALKKQSKQLDYIQKEEIARKKITDALREDILLRDRIAKLNKKEYGTPSKTPSKINYIEQEERQRKKMMDALKRDILQRDEQEMASQAKKVDYIKQEELAREKVLRTLKEDILLRDRIAKLDEKEAVANKKTTSYKLKQLQIDKEKVNNLTLATQRIGSNKNVAVVNGYPDNKVFVDEIKIKEKNIKLNNKLLAFETKMQGFAGGKIKSVQKELSNIRSLQTQHTALGKAMLNEKLTAEQINKVGLKRIDIEGKIANQQRVASNLANKGTLYSNTMSNLSIGKLANRASFVATAKLSYTGMQLVADAFRTVINLNVKLQDELSKTFAIMIDKSNEAKSKMRSGVMDVMAKYNMTLEDSTEGLYNVISAQIEESKALNVLNVSASTAKANFSDLGNTTKLITGILNAYNMEADEASRVSDVLSESVRLGTVTLDEYANSLGNIIPSANSAGGSYEELTAVITTMTKKGIHADKAITSLRQVFQMLTTPTKKQIDLLEDYGIDLNVLDLKANGLIKTMEQLGGVLLEDQFGIATSRRGREALLSFLGDIGANYENLDQIMNANGATQRMLAERTNTLSSNWDTLTKTLSNFIATRSGVEGFFGSLNSLIGSYNEAVNLANIQTESMINSDVLSIKFSENYLNANKLTNEINKLIESTDDLVDPTSEVGKKLKELNRIYFDAGMNVDLLNTSQINLNKTLEESIDVYERMAKRKLAIDKKAEIQTAIWEVQAKKVARRRELGVQESRDKLKTYDFNDLFDSNQMSMANNSSFIVDLKKSIFSYDADYKRFGKKDILKEIEKELKINIGDHKDIFYKFIRDARELRRKLEDDQLRALTLQENQHAENLSLWEDIIKMSENDAIKSIDEMNESEKARLKELEEKKTKLDTSISNFKETAFNFGDSSDKVQTRSNISQKITDAKKLRGEIEELRKLDDTYDKEGSLLKWANAQINKLEVEFNSTIRDFSDFPITVDAKINDILNEAVSSVNSSMSDEKMEELANQTIGKLSTYLESINEQPVDSEITKWLDDLLSSMRNAFKNYKPAKITASLDDLDIPLQVDISKIIENGLENVTDTMTQEQYAEILDNMIASIIKSMINSGVDIDPVLIAELEDMLIKAITNRAKSYNKKVSKPTKKLSFGNAIMEEIGYKNIDREADDYDANAETKEVANIAVNTVAQTTSAMLDLWNAYYEEKLRLKLESIENEREAEVSSVNSEILTSEHRANEINAINNKYAKKKEKMEEYYQKKQGRLNKGIAMAQATMDFASGSMGILSHWQWNPVVTALLQGLLSVAYGANMALISKQKFRDGGMLEGASHENGGISLLSKSGNYYGEAEGGEVIFSRKASSKNADFLLSMNKHLTRGGDLSTFFSSYLNGRSSGGSNNIGSIYRDGGITRRFSQNGSTIDASMFERFAFIDLEGVDERQIYRMSKMGKMKSGDL